MADVSPQFIPAPVDRGEYEEIANEPEEMDEMLRNELATDECKYNCNQGCNALTCCSPHYECCPYLCAHAIWANRRNGDFNPVYYDTKREWWAIACCVAPCTFAGKLICCRSPFSVWTWLKTH